jgi:hypothetical protein
MSADEPTIDLVQAVLRLLEAYNEDELTDAQLADAFEALACDLRHVPRPPGNTFPHLIRQEDA